MKLLITFTKNTSRSHLCGFIFLHRWKYPERPAGGAILWSNGLPLQRRSHKRQTTSFTTEPSERNGRSIAPADMQNCIWPITWLTERQRPIRRSFWPSIWTSIYTVRDEFRHLTAAARSGQTGESTTSCSDTDKHKPANRESVWSGEGGVRRTADRQRGDWGNRRWRNPEEPWIWRRDPEHPEVPELPAGNTLQGIDKPDDPDGLLVKQQFRNAPSCHGCPIWLP